MAPCPACCMAAACILGVITFVGGSSARGARTLPHVLVCLRGVAMVYGRGVATCMWRWALQCSRMGHAVFGQGLHGDAGSAFAWALCAAMQRKLTLCSVPIKHSSLHMHTQKCCYAQLVPA